ncbi:MAG TPA: site-specific integrase [Bryobacteraceae bacterium]|nr:site-specific integrase [Bryobacteraceae bacterium]
MSLKGRNVRVRGKWWHYQFEANGETHSGNTGLAASEQNRTAAENFAERKRQALLQPQLVAATAMETEAERRRKPFDRAAGEFIAWAEQVEYRGKPATSQRLKVSMASCVAFFGARPVAEIDAAALEDYKVFRIQEHGVKDVTLRHDLHALSVLFRWAIRRRLTDANPVSQVRVPSDRDAVREHVISIEEERKYLEAALKLHAEFIKTSHLNEATRRPNMHDLAVLMLELGARPEELLAARKEAVDLAMGTLQITGGKTRAARRTLNLTPRALSIIEPRLQLEGAWLFPSDRRPGEHLTKLQVTHDRICIEAGVSFVIYDFRHTFATRMVAAGVDVPTVAAILGHNGLRTIYRYVHPTAETQRAAMERFAAAQARARLKVVNE